jgi:hypothetical protein
MSPRFELRYDAFMWNVSSLRRTGEAGSSSGLKTAVKLEPRIHGPDCLPGSKSALPARVKGTVHTDAAPVEQCKSR